VPLAPSTFSRTHAVLQLPTISGRDPRQDEIFIAAVADEFPNVVSHQALAAETPLIAPHLVLASTSSQLALSAMQADFEVRFYGDYATDIERALEFVERKLRAILKGYDALGARPMMIGAIATLEFSFSDQQGAGPAEHILGTHLRIEVDPGVLQDALARVAVGLRDTYFLTMTVSNYESRILERPILPGLNAIQVRPWEGRLNDVGVQLTIDINNNLELRTREQTPIVTEAGLRAVMSLLRETATTAGPQFVEAATLSVSELAATSSPS
jgi:hypothetical protein